MPSILLSQKSPKKSFTYIGTKKAKNSHLKIKFFQKNLRAAETAPKNGKSGYIIVSKLRRPQFYISDMIKIMKGNHARQMFLLHPELKKELWGGHLWNPSYYAVTVSDRSREQVSAYIEGQKEKEKRKP